MSGQKPNETHLLPTRTPLAPPKDYGQFRSFSAFCPVTRKQTKQQLLKSPLSVASLTSPHCFYGGGNGTPLQYSCLENPMDRGAWWAAVHGVAKSRTRLSNFTFRYVKWSLHILYFHSHALEKEMATHSSGLAWRIPGTGDPGGLPSMGSHGVGHDWSDLAAAAAHIYQCHSLNSSHLLLPHVWFYFLSRTS